MRTEDSPCQTGGHQQRQQQRTGGSRHLDGLGAGKVVLAAIVHHDDGGECNNNSKLTADQSHLAAKVSNTHGGESFASKRKLSKLFFTNKKVTKKNKQQEQEQKEQVQEEEEETTLIDNVQQPGRGKRQSTKQISSDEIEAANYGYQSHPAQQHQVIEFKFDLIVDHQERSAGEPMTSKLDDNVDELVESFALDSNDVCLLSLGRQRRLAADEGQFDYLSRLAAHTLAYSFHLLKSKVCPQTPSSDRVAAISATETNQHSCSVEICATLFLSDADEGQFNIVDVLADEGNDDMPNCDGEETKQPSSSSTVDCATVEDALVVIDRMNAKLRQPTRGIKLLLVGLKLKQRINGGLFSNRLSLIDFDPKFYQLHPIFESIFNGQALAHLKRQKHQLSQQLDDREADGLAKVRAASLASCELGADANKQHHQVASHYCKNLSQAEWLLYKQLSSALIRTLIIVNVHKLSRQAAGGDRHEELERQLMGENLSLLEFARLIQRASTSRLRRRKRHLKSHLASSTVSVSAKSGAANQPQHEIGLHLGSPFRAAKTRPAEHPNKFATSYQRTRKASMDMNLVLSRHHSRHHQRCTRWDRHRNHAPWTGRSDRDFTESSSISTSSGSQRATRRQSSDRNANSGDARDNLSTTLNYLSDTDSVTSANLNSCSSSSYINKNLGEDIALRRLQTPKQLANVVRQQQRLHELPQPCSSPLLSNYQVAKVQHMRCSPLRSARRSSSTSRASCEKASRTSSVIEIDCQPVTNQSSRTSDLEDATRMLPSGDEISVCRLQSSAGDMTDNVSEICSVVAEPPKQLKLEEFLNQFSSIIQTPSRKTSLADPSSESQKRLTPRQQCIRDNQRATESSNYNDNDEIHLTLAGYNSGQQQQELHLGIKANSAYEDEEDCKSHSSILEHLSSLALESNTKLHLRNQMQMQQSQRQHETTLPMDNNSSTCTYLEPPPPPPPLDFDHDFLLDADTAKSNATTTTIRDNGANYNDTKATTPPTGHLQRLLNNSAQLRKTNNNPSRVVVLENTVEERLKALTINCRDLAPDSPSSASSGAFVLSSNDSSSCSSSSSSTVAVVTTGPAVVASGTHQQISLQANYVAQQSLYASVIRQDQNVKT